jgi:hypothetical protein
MDKQAPDHQLARQTAALAFASLDVILILLTLINQLPRLGPAFLIPYPQVLVEASVWFTLASISFCCAVLVALYCLISLWIPEVKFILWYGAAAVVGSGVLYLVAAVMYYRGAGMGVPVQQGLFMFLLSLSVPILAARLSRRGNPHRAVNPLPASSAAPTNLVSEAQ